MATKPNPIKKYTKKDGSTAYMFKKYLGIDPVTGKQRETTRRGFASLKEAKLAYARLDIDVAENGIKQRSSNRAYKEVFEDWFNLVYKTKVKESTYWNTRIIFDKHILPALGSYNIKAITVTACQKQANAWCKDNPNRYDRYINYAGMIFKYAESIGEIQSNPMQKIILPTPVESIEGDEPEVINFCDRQELLSLLKELKENYPFKRFVFFSLLAYTGLRKGEALALTWRDIDFKHQTLTVNKTLAVGKNGTALIQKPKTKAGVRTISIDSDTADLLKEWRYHQKKHINLLAMMPSIEQLVFAKDEDNGLMNPRTPQTWLDTLYRKNKSLHQITPHGFRHTHASLLFEAGASMKQVQARLGHSNIKTTMNVYTHVTKEGKEETADIFGEFMRNGKSLGQSLGQNKNPAQ
ncbi:tyrosine-type recombinase/integrase [Enterococcus pernyi]